MSRVVRGIGNYVGSHQPTRNSVADTQKYTQFRRPEKGQIKQGQPIHRVSKSKKARRDGNQKSEQTGTKSSNTSKTSKTTNASSDYRRRRILNNLSMINRLETNIERMEEHLQGLGFDLSTDGVTITSSPSCSELDPAPNIATSKSCTTYDSPTNLGPPASAAISGISTNPFELPITAEENYSFLDSVSGFSFPRCLLDIPTTGGFSALSFGGLEWVSQKSGVEPIITKYQCTMSHDISFDDLFPGKEFCPLPPKEDLISLLHEYLQNFNSLCPLYQESKLISLFNCDKLDVTIHNPARWANINVVLALGIMLRTNDRSVAQPDPKKGWLFIKNALGVVNELCIYPPSLWSIQALLGMATFLLGTSTAQLSSFLVSTAIRLCHQIGLERTEDRITLCSEELEQRRRVFWIAYCLDRDISLRFDKPLMQRDDDMCVNLPKGTSSETVESTPIAEQTEFDVFRACCELAVIKGELYRHLYSVSAKNRPLDEIISSVGSLDERLQEWKKSLPSRYQPEAQILPTLPRSQISVMLLFLHYSYFNCVIAIHRLIAAQGIRLGVDLAQKNGGLIAHPPSSSSRAFISASLCASAARASIKLMRYMPEGNACIVGILIHYPIVALMTLSSTIIQNPLDASRTYDMGLIGQVEKFMSSLVLHLPDEGTKQLANYCAKYRSAAEIAVRNAKQQFCGR